jgi:hypothetical protein
MTTLTLPTHTSAMHGTADQPGAFAPTKPHGKDHTMSNQNIRNGGDAFPVSTQSNITFRGMTLRDWFAGQALAGISASQGDGYSLSPQNEAEWAYQRADAMIAVRSIHPDVLADIPPT